MQCKSFAEHACSALHLVPFLARTVIRLNQRLFAQSPDIVIFTHICKTRWRTPTVALRISEVQKIHHFWVLSIQTAWWSMLLMPACTHRVTKHGRKVKELQEHCCIHSQQERQQVVSPWVGLLACSSKHPNYPDKAVNYAHRCTHLQFACMLQSHMQGYSWQLPYKFSFVILLWFYEAVIRATASALCKY